MDVYEAVTRRRSIRRFKDKPVSYEILKKCVDAGRLAPVARNRQMCEYVVVDDKQMLSGIFDTIATWAGQHPSKQNIPPETRPKAYILTLVESPTEDVPGGQRPIMACNVGMSAENMILVALENRLGACPVLSFQQDRLKPLLKIPDRYEVAMLLALGYPDESPVVEVAADSTDYWVDGQGVRHVPKRKLEDILHHNKF